MKLEKIFFVISFVLILVGIVGGLFYLKQNYSSWNGFLESNVVKSPKEKTETKTEKTKIIFYFRIQEKRLIKNEANIFPEKIELSRDLPEEWLILNFLNHSYPDWSKYYTITKNTLRKPIHKINYIFFKPLFNALEKKKRENFNEEDLRKLNIDTDRIEIEKIQLIQLLNLIQNPLVNWEKIETYIRRNFDSKDISIVMRKIKESLYFY